MATSFDDILKESQIENNKVIIQVLREENAALQKENKRLTKRCTELLEENEKLKSFIDLHAVLGNKYNIYP